MDPIPKSEIALWYVLKVGDVLFRMAAAYWAVWFLCEIAERVLR